MSCFPSEPAIPRVSAWYAEGGDPVDGLTSLSPPYPQKFRERGVDTPD